MSHTVHQNWFLWTSHCPITTATYAPQAPVPAIRAGSLEVAAWCESAELDNEGGFA